MEIFWNILLGVLSIGLTTTLGVIGWFIKKTINKFEFSIEKLNNALTDVIQTLVGFNSRIDLLSKDLHYKIEALHTQTEDLRKEIDVIKEKHQ